MALDKMFTQHALVGDHNVFFYSSAKEKYEVLFSNLKAGLERGCSALYITSGEANTHVQVEMENFGLKIDNPLKLRIAASYDFYTPDGEFHADRVTGQFRSLIDESVDKGFEGLYVSSDAINTFDYLAKKDATDVWFDYENALGRTFKLPMEAICAYSTDQIKSNDKVLLQLIQAHKNTITAGNPNFVNNEKICFDAVAGECKNILGEEATEFIFDLIEKRFKIRRNQIPNRIVEFNKALESILSTGAKPLEIMIIRNLRKKIEL